MDDAGAAQLFLPITLATIMFALGLGLVVDDFRRVAGRPRAVGVGLAGQLVVLPVLAMIVASVLTSTTEAAVGLVLLASCPGGVHSNLFASLGRGDTALSIGLTAISGVATLITLPLWVFLAAAVFGNAGESVSLAPGSTASTLLAVVVLPTLSGMGLRHLTETWARRLEVACKSLAVLLLAVIVVGSVARNGSLVVEHARAVGAAVVVLNVSAMAAGALLARAAHLDGPEILSITLEVGVQNSAVAVGLALTLLGLPYAVPAIVYSLFVYLTAAAAVAWGRATLTSQPGHHLPARRPAPGGSAGCGQRDRQSG